MTLHVNIPISPELFKQAKERARQKNKEVPQILADHLESTFYKQLSPEELAAEKERLAYHALHPFLLEKYEGKYVAILGEKLVDHDDDKLKLFRRMAAKFPDNFVLIRQVASDPEPELTLGTLRLKIRT
mgnify:CR=1 FL=1